MLMQYRWLLIESIFIHRLLFSNRVHNLTIFSPFYTLQQNKKFSIDVWIQRSVLRLNEQILLWPEVWIELQFDWIKIN